MSTHGISTDLAIQLHKKGRERLRVNWEKAEDRADRGDLDGAITASRTFLESVCKYTLDITKTEYKNSYDLPKLYDIAASTLGISAKSEVSELNRTIFRSIFNVVRSIGEMRNKIGDAHGKGFNSADVSANQARLAINLSASVAQFIIANLDSHIAAADRMTPDGEAILIFDKSTVWRLLDHAKNSPTRLNSSEGVSSPALLLVGDAGVYLMSNGSPPQLQDGSVKDAKEAGSTPRLVAYADGCGRFDDVAHWWPIHSAIEAGSDFSRSIEIEYFDKIINDSDKTIVIIAGPEGETFYSDREWQLLVDT